MPQTFTITNSGPSGATTLSSAITGTHSSDFAVLGDNCVGRPLLVGHSCTVDASFNPTATGPRTANLQVRTGTSAFSATLTGRGVM
jgi:hypothetical protein